MARSEAQASGQEVGGAMSEEFTLIGYKVNELLYYWRGTYWRWTRSPMVKDDPPHVFEELTDEHKEGWNFACQEQRQRKLKIVLDRTENL